MVERGIQLKTRGELQAMRASGLVLADAIAKGRAVVAPGVSSNEGFFLTAATACAAAGCWFSPGNRW